MNIRCMINLHRYSRWTDGGTFERSIPNHSIGAGTIEGIPFWISAGKFMAQWRECEACGLKQSRRVDV